MGGGKLAQSYAGVAEVADAPGLGPGIERCAGSSPVTRTSLVARSSFIKSRPEGRSERGVSVVLRYLEVVFGLKLTSGRSLAWPMAPTSVVKKLSEHAAG